MKRIVIYLCLLLSLTLLPVSAQDSQFRLQNPSANDYLTFLDDVLLQFDAIDRSLYDATIETMQISGVSLFDADYINLISTYNQLFDSIPFAINHTAWHNAILISAIRENRLSLADADFISFEDYEIDITPVDFDDDSTIEYLLDVRYKPMEYPGETQYEAYHIAYLNAENVMAITATPLRANYAGMAHYTRGYWETYPPRDFNNDGNIEWIVIEQGVNTGPGSQSRGFARIFAWRDLQMVNIAPHDFGFSNDDRDKISWEWDDFDGDGVIEFDQTYRHYNNWSCTYETLTRIDWSDDTQTYDYGSKTDIIPDSFGCFLTGAEEAMWQGDYETAMPLYEQALQIGIPEDVSSWELSRYQYAQLRLALAYTMLDHINDAQLLLDNLVQQTPATETMDDLISTVTDVDLETSGGSGLCVAMHDFFTGDFVYIGTFIGYTLVDFENFHTNLPSTVNPLYAGCNLSQFVTDRLGESPFLMDESPVERFIEAGIAIRESVNADLNGDGLDDWLIFPELLIDPYLFLSDETSTDYLVLRPDFRAGTDAEVRTTSLSGRIQVHYLAYDVLMTINGSPVCPGNYQVWEFVDNQARYLFLKDVCERLSLDEIIQADGYELHLPLGVSGSYFGNCSADTPMIYI